MNDKPLILLIFRHVAWRDARGRSLGQGFLRHAVNPSLDALGAAIRAAQGLKSPTPSHAVPFF